MTLRSRPEKNVDRFAFRNQRIHFLSKMLLTRKNDIGAIGFCVLLIESLPALHKHPLDGEVHGTDLRTEVADDRHGEVKDDVRVPLDDLTHVERAEDCAARSLHSRVGEECRLCCQHLRTNG